MVLMYRLSEAAASDIDDILEQSVQDFGTSQTATYFNSLKHCLELLANNPAMGTAIDDIRAGYRCFQHESHIIFYTIEHTDIFIVRILHKRMDALRNLEE